MGGDVFSLTGNQTQFAGTAINTINNNIREEGIVIPGILENGEPNTKRISAQEYFENMFWPAWLGGFSEGQYFDGSYIKLREVIVEYKLPISGWTNNAVKTATIAIFGRNLFLLYTHPSNIHGIDPGVSMGMRKPLGNNVEYYNTPKTRSLGIKIGISF